MILRKATAEIEALAAQFKAVPVEIKSGQTVTSDYLKGIRFWNKMSGNQGGYVVYGGEMNQHHSDGINIVPYTELNSIG